MSDAARARLLTADMVISKGQGNFEGLYGNGVDSVKNVAAGANPVILKKGISKDDIHKRLKDVFQDFDVDIWQSDFVF